MGALYNFDSQVRKRIEEQRKGRVELESKMPKINKDLFMKLTIDGE